MSSPSERVVSITPEDNCAAHTPAPRTQTRLAILNNFIPPYWKPVFACLAERYAHFRVLVSTPMEPNRAWDIDWQGLDVIRQKTITLRGSWRHPKGFKESLFVHLPIDTVSQLRRFHADVVLSVEMGFRTLMSLAYRKLNPKSKLIIWAEIAESTESGRGKLRGALRRFLARHADAFIVFGNSGARYLRTLNVADSEIFIVPYATNVSHFGRNSLRRAGQQQRRLLYVGQLIERKGLLPFLQVLTRWASDHPDRPVELTLAGEGPLHRKLREISTPANLKLELLGNIGYEDLPRIYAMSGVFVFPTLADSWGLVVNEAMASGLPVLGSVYAQSVEMLVVDGRNGWTFRPDSPEDTYRAVDCCMNTAIETLEEMREQARDTAGMHTPEHVAYLIDQVVMTCRGEVVPARGEK